MQKHITIPERFRGPPTSGNGGYVAGAFAEQVQQNPDQAIEVTLRAPIPLNAAMSVHRHDAADRASVTIEIDADSTSALSTTKTLIAEVRLQPFSLDIPTPPTYQQALAIRHLAVPLQQRQDSPMPGSLGLHPICFCCGAGHPTGLQVYAAPLQTGQVAADWPGRCSLANPRRMGGFRWPATSQVFMDSVGLPWTIGLFPRRSTHRITGSHDSPRSWYCPRGGATRGHCLAD